MKQEPDTRDLQDLLQGAEPPSFRPGFSGRLRYALQEPRLAGEPEDLLDRWIRELFPRLALGAACLLLLLGAWNLGGAPEGDLVTRLLSLPDVTLANSLDLAEGGSR